GSCLKSMALFIPVLPILRPMLSGNAALPAHPWSMATGHAERYSTDRVARATPRSTAHDCAGFFGLFSGLRRAGNARPPLLGLQRAGRDDIDGVERGRRRDEQTIPLRASEADIRNHFRHVDLAEQLALARVDMDAVAGRGPNIAVGVQAETVGEAGLDLREDAAVGQPLAADDVQSADVMGALGI